MNTSLEKVSDYGVQGWSAITDSNIEKIDDDLRGPLLADKYLSETSVDNPDPITVHGLTDSSGGTSTTTVGAVSGSGADTAINDNFASLVAENNKLKDDVTELRTQLVALLAALRKTGGCGVLGD